MFTGTGVALVTPFKKDDSIDFRALTNIVEHVINNKVEYLVALGTTAETPVLSEEEQQSVVRHVREINNGRVPLVVGMGGNNTALAVNVEVFPSHIASLPVAVNIQCHAHRHKEITI